MKLISLNVALFEKNNEKLKKFVKEQKADILCFQEVVRRLDLSVDPDFISKNAIDSVNNQLSYSFFAPLSIVSNFESKNFHGHTHFKFNLGGFVEFGNYVKSRYQIIKGENIFLLNHFTYRTDWENWPEEDYRAVQIVDVKIDGKKMRLLNYHGVWSRDKKDSFLAKKACETIFKIACAVDYPVIICGDFNLFPDTQAIKLFDKKFINLINTHKIKTTRPANNELNNHQRNVVDYIFISNGIKLNKFQVIDADISDHLPLVVEFEI